MESRIWRWRLRSLLCTLVTVLSPVTALSNAYCSPENTGGDLAQQSIYMSMGRCHDACNTGYAFAIVQADECWCSNFIPANQVSTSQCNTPCPGFPSDLCGNKDAGLYGYIKLDSQPSGTAGGSSSSAPTSSTSSAGGTTSLSTTSSSSSSTPDPVTTSEFTTSSSVYTSSSSLSSSQSQEPQQSSTLPPTTSVVIITASGSVVTQTVISTPTQAGSGGMITSSRKSSGLSGGLIAAAVIASVLGVALIGAIAFFFLRHRRRDGGNDEKFGDINDDPNSPQNLNRNTSTHSKAGLLGRGYPPTVTTTRMSRVSSMNGQEMSSSDAISPVTPNSDQRRASRLVMYDQRLNPNNLMIIDNGSHTSLNTLDDHRDYGRMLKVTNPDESHSNRPSMSRQRSFQ